MMYCILSSVINQENHPKMRAGSLSFTSFPELSEMGRSINVYIIFVWHFLVYGLGHKELKHLLNNWLANE